MTGLPCVVVLLCGDLDHEAVGGGAVAVVLAGFEEHTVAGSDHLGQAALALAAADTLDDVDRLPVRVGMPRSPGARREMNECRDEGRRAGTGAAMGSIYTSPVNQAPGALTVSMLLRVICISGAPCRM